MMKQHLETMSASFKTELVNAFNGAVRDFVKDLIREIPHRAAECKSHYQKFLLAVQLSPSLPIQTISGFLGSNQRLCTLLDAKDEKFFTNEVATLPFVSEFKLDEQWTALTNEQKAIVWRDILKIVNLARTYSTADEIINPQQLPKITQTLNKVSETIAAAPSDAKVEDIAKSVASNFGIQWTPEHSTQLSKFMETEGPTLLEQITKAFGATTPTANGAKDDKKEFLTNLFKKL